MKRRTKDKVSGIISWEDGLRSGEITEGNDTELGIQLETPGVTTHLVTDGRVGGSSGYYGWLIASSDQIIYKGKGRLSCHSSQLQSLRPESTSYLSCTTFLLKFIREKNIRIKTEIRHHVDNMTLVQRMRVYNCREAIRQS